MSLYLRKLLALTLIGFSTPEPSKPSQQPCLIWLSHWQGRGLPQILHNEYGRKGLGTVIFACPGYLEMGFPSK